MRQKNIDNHKVSVVIPNYNSENTLRKCVESAILQTHKVEEIIIVDDGSTDDSINIIKELQSQNTETRIISLFQENKGPSVARNKAIQMASGNWIAFLDSDDYWVENKIEIQLDFAQAHTEAVLISGGYNKVFFNKQIEYKNITHKMLCVKNYFETPCVLVRKDIIVLYPFNEAQKYSEDYRVWLQIGKYHKMYYINRLLSFNINNKKPYGESGLSANLWEMEKGELSNFLFLYKKKIISFGDWLFYSSFSFLKFIRRYLISKIF